MCTKEFTSQEEWLAHKETKCFINSQQDCRNINLFATQTASVPAEVSDGFSVFGHSFEPASTSTPSQDDKATCSSKSKQIPQRVKFLGSPKKKQAVQLFPAKVNTRFCFPCASCSEVSYSQEEWKACNENGCDSNESLETHSSVSEDFVQSFKMTSKPVQSQSVNVTNNDVAKQKPRVQPKRGCNPKAAPQSAKFMGPPKKAIQVHEAKGKSRNVLSCKQCSKTFYSFEELVAHNETSCKAGEEPSTKRSSRSRQETHASRAPVDTSHLLECDFPGCGLLFKSVFTLNRHKVSKMSAAT